jgi:membrane protein implicated in regulation of membrane protease activity
VQPSSLVFLVIIAVWAAYFVQYWVRRREHLATARSVDQFSESMRVLERRSPLPASNLSTPQPRSYAVTPARAARPQVLVKRAETSQAEVPTPPVEAEPSAPRISPVVARRNRAMIMLGALSTVVVAVPLVALSMLPMLALLVPLVSVVGAVVWARSAARAERRARRESRPGRSVQSGRSAQSRVAAPDAAPDAAVEDVRGAEAGAVAVDAGGEVEPVVGIESDVVAKPVKPELFDVQAQPAGAAAPAAVMPEAVRIPARQLVDEDDIPLTWDPVPVPRPTYTMKSRVTRPAPTSADLVGDADTEYAAYEELPERRVAGA